MLQGEDESQGTTKNINHTNEGGRIPLDSDSSINFIIPVART